MIIREATAQDAIDFYDGKPPSNSFHGFVAVQEGRVIGIAGVYYDGPVQVAFSDMKEEMKKYKKDIIRGTRLVMQMIEKRGLTVYAECAEGRAANFVRRVGFKEIKTVDDKKVMVWTGIG